jgi:hypothetical protein
MSEPLLSYQELARAKNMTVREVRTLKYKKIIPHVELGHRTIRFYLSRVDKALQKREVREV